jgi:isocitrate dehydrogenase
MRFATTLEQVTVATVESGFMTKDLALLVGDQQGWLTTEGFLDKVAENVAAAMGGSGAAVGNEVNAHLDM